MRRLRFVPTLLAIGACATSLAACGGDPETESATAAPTGKYHRFRSAPDLQPPVVAIRKKAKDTAPGYIFLASKEEGKPSGPLIVDDAGQVVWFEPVQPRHAADLRVQRYRGKTVLTWWEGTQPTIGIGAGKFVIADTSYRRIAEFDAGKGLDGDLHELLITADDTALVIAYTPVPHDLTSLGGRRNAYVWDNAIQELDIETGKVLFEWRSLEHVEVTESAQRVPARTASKKKPFDYFHANSIDVDSDGDLLVSARNTHAVYKIDRPSGRVEWTLGGRNTDFELGKGVKFAWQHDARREEDGTITLFDNSAKPKVAEQSRALKIRVDARAKTATLVRAYAHPAGILAPHQGNAQRLPNGNLLVGWGGKPFLTEFSENGKVSFHARLADGDSYRAYRFEWSGRPASKPSVFAQRGRGDSVTVYASWNGATEVAEWEILDGHDPNDLERIDKTDKLGFETIISTKSGRRYVAVRALDADGEELGTSDAVEVAER